MKNSQVFKNSNFSECLCLFHLEACEFLAKGWKWLSKVLPNLVQASLH